MTEIKHLTTSQMAQFAARGFLQLDTPIPDALNKQFLNDIGKSSEQPDSIINHYDAIRQSSTIPIVPAGTALRDAYPKGSAPAKLLADRFVAGAIDSLVGLDCLFDHHFLHITFPEEMYPDAMRPVRAQNTHQDSTIDPRQAFDVQVFYFPHEVTLAMGGTRFIPSSHFRIVSEASIGRYQNVRGQQHVICPAGTVMFFHMGLWHGGGMNRSDQKRYMFKIRLCPSKRQRRLWDPNASYDKAQRAIFWTGGQQPDSDHLHSILTRPEKWFELDTGRLEYINRIRFWRYLTGDKNFDADYWLTRVENEYTD